MSKIVKLKSTTVEQFQCGCGHKIRYRFYKNYVTAKKSYQGYKTRPKLTEQSFYYKISWLGAWKLDRHHYKCERYQND